MAITIENDYNSLEKRTIDTILHNTMKCNKIKTQDNNLWRATVKNIVTIIMIMQRVTINNNTAQYW